MCFVHTHSSPLTPPRATPLPYSPSFLYFLINPIKFNLCCPNILGYVAFHWSMVDLPATIL